MIIKFVMCDECHDRIPDNKVNEFISIKVEGYKEYHFCNPCALLINLYNFDKIIKEYEINESKRTA